MRKISFLLMLGYFLITLSGCGNSNGWRYLSASECYNRLGELNEEMSKDEQGNIINCFNENYEQEGKRVEYYENGQIYYEENYENGERNGKSITYYENGQILSEGFWKNGQQDGEWIFYYEDGQISCIRTLKDGEIDGESINYYENGQIESEEIWSGGEIRKMIHYYEDGNFESENVYHYENGFMRMERLNP